jgi:hypothetical protein
MFAVSAARTTTARHLRQGLFAIACCASLGLAHAEDSAMLVASANVNTNTNTNTIVNASPLAASSADPAAPIESLQSNALYGQAADVGSTGIGLALGAAEANPLGIMTLGIKAVAYQKIKNSPPVEQPRLWGMYGALGWGAAANNLCVIAAIATGGVGAAVCPLIGLGAGMGSWSANTEERNKATFAAMCEVAKITNPDLVCVYNGSNS